MERIFTMKKFLSVLLAVIMCVLPLAGNMTVAAAEAQATYTFESVEVYPGNKVSIALSLETSETFNTIGMAAISYDEDVLEYVGYEFNEKFSGKCMLCNFGSTAAGLILSAAATTPFNGFEGVLVTLNFAVKDDAPIGETEITGTASLKNNATNLTTDVVNGTVTVLGRDFDPALKFNDSEVEYDGEYHALEVKNVPDFAEVEYTVDGEAFDGARNAGEYEVTAVVTADGYNTFEETATLTITPKEANVTVTVPGKVYDGTTTVLEDPEIEIDGLVDGDDVEIVVEELEYRSADAGSVGFDWGASSDGADADNYVFDYNFPEATIAKMDIVVKVTDVDLTVGDDMPEEYGFTTEPALVEGDELVGTVAVAKGANTDAAGTYAIKGTFTAENNPNYNITDIVNGTLTVEDKIRQEVELEYDVPAEVVYGDNAFEAGFRITDVTTSENVNDVATTYETTDDSVAVVNNEGLVTFVGAGTANILAKREGNDEYAAFEEKIEVTVAKLAVTITVKDAQKRIGKAAPEYTYTLETENGIETPDEFDVTLSCDYEDVVGETFNIVADYTVENAYCYKVVVNNGKLAIIDKNPTEVVVDTTEIEATYGDSAVVIEATLNAFEETAPENVVFTYSSDDENVVAFEDETVGSMTVVGAGEAVVTVSYAGNEDFAADTAEIKVTVAPKTLGGGENDVTVDVAEGVLTISFNANAGLTIDLNKTNVVLDDNGTEETEDDTYVLTSVAEGESLPLAGDGAENYTAPETMLLKVSQVGELVLAVVTDGGTVNGHIEGLGSYLAGVTVTLTAVPEGNYKFKNWLMNGEEYEGEATIEFVLEEDVEFTAEFKKGKVASVVGGGSTSTRTVTFVIDEKNSEKVTVDQGEKVKAPADPELEGYTFEGWFTDKACTKSYDFNTKVNSSITLYAKFVAIEEEPEEDPTEEPEEWTNPYADVKDNDWFYDAVKTVSAKGIMNGMKEGEFAPNVALTRAMLVTMLYRIEGSPEVDGDVAYTDVNLDEYYGDALVWATENKIVNGVSETEFAPNANITREQIATIIYRYAGFKGVEAVELSENLHFDDADKISDYAVAPMNWLVGKEIIKGYENNTIQPQGNATRAEVATIVTRILAFLG